MTPDEKLAAIRSAVQIDPGTRGLARLFESYPDDFANACRSLAETRHAACRIRTGFYIPSAEPPAFETDGPLGAAFLVRAFATLGIGSMLLAEEPVLRAIGLDATASFEAMTHDLAIERAGPAADGNHYTMRGRDLTPFLDVQPPFEGPVTIGIGDGGNEVGMGKLPHEFVAGDIPNGDRIHCRVPADHLLVVGVSNWGAYALAAGLFVLRGVEPPAGLFDPDRERATLEAMVRAGPLVDGVTGRPTATVDGLTWDEYAAPLVRIAAILEAS